MLNGQVKSKLGLGLGALLSLGDGLLGGNDGDGVDDSLVSSNLLGLNLIDIVDDSSVSVWDVNDVVG